MAEFESLPANPSLDRPSGMLRRLFSSHRIIAIGYMAFLIIAEAMTTLIEPRVGMVAHGLLLLMLFLHASLWNQGRLRGFLLSLALAPLIRLLSLSLPLPSFPFIYWYMVVGAPLLISALVASQVGKINRRMLGLTMRNLPAQLLIASSGVLLGYLEYRILRPDPLISELRLDLLWIPALILLIFTGFLEEWVFRGLMQYTAMRSFGRFGFYYVAAVFAVLHLGYKSALDVFFVFVVAIFFGWAAQKTGSILGVTLSHGLTNIGLFLVFPFIAVGLPTLPPLLPDQTPVTETRQAPAPGLLAPVVTLEATRPWVPPTSTSPPMLPTQPTTAKTFTPSIEWTLKPEQPTATETLGPPQSVPTCTPRRDWFPYVVQPGDTLFYIAQSTGVSVEQLLQANCSTSFTIYSGQVLYIPFRMPTQRPMPTATGTMVPTDTPAPLPTALPTETSEPTSMPTETETPAPTETPVPTDTDIPVPTETLTEEPVITETPTP